MKNSNSLKWIFFLVVLAIGLNTHAELPALSNGYPTFTLPHKFQMSPLYHNIGYINMDGLGDPEYYVEFNSSGIGTYSYCIIRDYNSSYTGNQVLTEFYNPQPPNAPALNEIPLSTPGEPFAALLTSGEIIGPLITSPPASGLAGHVPLDFKQWYFSPYIFQDPIGINDAPLASNYTNGLYSGYIGVHYLAENDQWYYGWLSVQIDLNGQWVLISSAGSSQIADDPIPAGFTPFAVPIPIIASIFGFALIGGGIYLRRRKKK